MPSRYKRDIYSSRSIPAGQELAILDFEWAGLPGEIYAYGIGSGSDSAWGNIGWRMSVDGIDVPDYSNTQDQIGSFDLMTDISVVVNPGARIKVYGRNATAGAVLMGARFKIRDVQEGR
jgi:hypothetical protein